MLHLLYILWFFQRNSYSVSLTTSLQIYKYGKEEVSQFEENIIQDLWEPFEKAHKSATKRPSSTVSGRLSFLFRQVQSEIWCDFSHLGFAWWFPGWCQCAPCASKHQLLPFKCHLLNKYVWSVHSFWHRTSLRNMAVIQPLPAPPLTEHSPAF